MRSFPKCICFMLRGMFIWFIIQLQPTTIQHGYLYLEMNELYMHHPYMRMQSKVFSLLFKFAERGATFLYFV